MRPGRRVGATVLFRQALLEELPALRGIAQKQVPCSKSTGGALLANALIMYEVCIEMQELIL